MQWVIKLYVRLFWFLFRVLLSFAIFARVLTPKVFCSNVLLLACEMQMSMIGHRVMYESSGNGRREMYTSEREGWTNSTCSFMATSSPSGRGGGKKPWKWSGLAGKRRGGRWGRATTGRWGGRCPAGGLPFFSSCVEGYRMVIGLRVFLSERNDHFANLRIINQDKCLKLISTVCWSSVSKKVKNDKLNKEERGGQDGNTWLHEVVA